MNGSVRHLRSQTPQPNSLKVCQHNEGVELIGNQVYCFSCGEHLGHKLTKKERETLKPNHIETAEQVHHACRVQLMRMESNLRVKGDVWRADRVKEFRVEYFGTEPEQVTARTHP